MDPNSNSDLNNNSISDYFDLDDCLQRITRNQKIEKAAILNNEGKVLTCSQNMQFGQTDLNGINCVFSGHSSLLMRLNLCESSYTCFRKSDDRNTIIGRSENSVLVLNRCQDFIIIGVGHSDTPGSCLHEVTKFGKKLRYKSKICLS